jgi:hypothetical protein
MGVAGSSDGLAEPLGRCGAAEQKLRLDPVGVEHGVNPVTLEIGAVVELAGISGTGRKLQATMHGDLVSTVEWESRARRDLGLALRVCQDETQAALTRRLWRGLHSPTQDLVAPRELRQRIGLERPLGLGEREK